MTRFPSTRNCCRRTITRRLLWWERQFVFWQVSGCVGRTCLHNYVLDIFLRPNTYISTHKIMYNVWHTHTHTHTHIYIYISLRAGRSVDRIQVGRKIFRTRPHRPCGPSSLLYNGNWVSFPGVKRSGRDVNHPIPSSAEIKERVELYPYSPSGSSCPVLKRNLLYLTSIWRQSIQDLYRSRHILLRLL